MTIQQAFELAFQHLQAGRFIEAEKIYRQILGVEPRHAESLHFLGIIAAQSGRNDLAVDLIRQAIAVKPNFPDAHNNLGTALRSQGRADESIAAHRQAIALNPNYPGAYFNLGIALRDQGNFDEAIAATARAIALHPNYPQAHYNLGILFSDKGQFDDAIAAYRQAIALRPNFAEAYNNLGAIYRDAGKSNEAEAAYRQAIAFNPNFPEAFSNLGSVLRDKGRLDEAIASCRRAIALSPNLADAHSSLGNALRDKGQLDEAIAACRQAIAINPKLADAHSNLAKALCDKGQLDEAIAACRQVIALKPDDAESYFNLGIVLREDGQLNDAVVAYRRAIAIKPKYPEAYSNLGNALKDQGLLDEALAAYRQAVAIKPDFVIAHSNVLFGMHYLPAFDADAIAQEHRRWNAQYAEPLRRNSSTAWPQDRDPERPLRIGYVSSDFREHPVGRSLLPLFRNHDRRTFYITCYSDVPFPDALTAQFKAHSDLWRQTRRLNHEQLAHQIEADQIDILVDLALHSAGNRLLVFARQPAPVQITYAGYPASTGMSAMQYRLTDSYLDPPGETEGYNSEQLLRLKHSFWCYPSNETEPPVNELPALTHGHITFGSLNNPCKHSQAALDLWSEVLKAVPDSKLMLLILDCDGLSAHFTREFQKRGIDPHRLLLMTKRPRADYMALYHQIDIGLDPLPYNGHMTSCDSFWMGVPVVSLRGSTSVGRGGVSLLSNLDLQELIAATPEEYIEIATGLCKDLTKLTTLRKGLRLRMQTSALCDGEMFARNVEELYSDVWRRLCEAKG